MSFHHLAPPARRGNEIGSIFVLPDPRCVSCMLPPWSCNLIRAPPCHAASPPVTQPRGIAKRFSAEPSHSSRRNPPLSRPGTGQDGRRGSALQGQVSALHALPFTARPPTAHMNERRSGIPYWRCGYTVFFLRAYRIRGSGWLSFFLRLRVLVLSP